MIQKSFGFIFSDFLLGDYLTKIILKVRLKNSTHLGFRWLTKLIETIKLYNRSFCRCYSFCFYISMMRPTLMQCFFSVLMWIYQTLFILARDILGRIVNCEGATIHFVRDKWIEPSIKDFERDDRRSLRGIYSSTEKKKKYQHRKYHHKPSLKKETFK